MSIEKFPSVESAALSDGVVLRLNASMMPAVVALADLIPLLTASGNSSFGDQVFSVTSGGTVSLARLGETSRIYLQAAASLASLTLVLPNAPTDNDVLQINTNQSVSALAFSLNGATEVRGAPSSLSTNATLVLNYRAANATWYKVS